MTVSPEAPDSSGPENPFEELPELVNLSDWEFDEALQEAEHLARSVAVDTGTGDRGGSWTGLSRMNHASPHTETAPTPSLEQPDYRQSAGSFTAPWLVLAAALGVFVCGVALISFSLASHRPLLWELGVPLALAGQVAVLAVVVWQLHATWNSNQATFVALHAMDDQVRAMRAQWSQIEHSGADTFYEHLANGANPEILLADLKEQIDVLSHHVEQTKRAA